MSMHKSISASDPQELERLAEKPVRYGEAR